MFRKLIFLMLIAMLPILVNAQYRNKGNRKAHNKRHLKVSKGTSSKVGYSFISKLIYGNIGQQVGGGIGSANFLGELGGAKGVGKGFFFDYKFRETRPALIAFYRLNSTPWFAARADLSFAMVGGSDANIKVDLPTTPQETVTAEAGWYRKYRNLSFRSHILELSAMFEFNLLRYEFGRRKYRYTPYVFGGVGIFHFMPKAKYNGQWVNLRKLGTEGQDFAAYPDRKRYSQIQPTIPLGIGFKYNFTREISFSFEYGYRITFTDYIDDVSKTYVDPQDILAEYPNNPETAQMIIDLSRRSTELDPDGTFGYVTRPGEQRGDPRSNDTYFFTGVIKMAYTFATGRSHAPKF